MFLPLVLSTVLYCVSSKPTPGLLPKAHRVILRFQDPQGVLSEGELLQRKTHELTQRPGVLGVKALEHVGMVIASCASLEAEEQLVRDLEEDPQVELATPDVPLRFDEKQEKEPQKPGTGDLHPLQDLRQCSAQSGCAALALVGQCCPAADGLMLACCDGQVTQNQVALKSYVGRYAVAEADGSMNVNRVWRREWETFQLLHNDDGTVSFRSFFGKYVCAELDGALNANRDLIGSWEKFTLIHNPDSTVSLLTHHNRFVVAELDGQLNANRENLQDWEKFTMELVDSSSQRIPNDRNFTSLWGMHEFEDYDIDAPEAWKTFTGEFSAGITVAVIDTGIDYEHEDLRDNMWVNPGEIPGNGLDDDGNGIVDDVHGADFANQDGDPMDDQLHGTHCAGSIAGVGNNGVGVAGVAWRGVKLMALKFLTATGSGQSSDAVQAINYAVAHGARISSNSWGGGGSSAAVRMAITRAEAAGMLFIAAAGNSGSDNDEDPHYPSTYPNDNIVAVASTTSDGLLSGFSCYGAQTVDVAAPGSRIFSTAPGDGYRVLSGTSMATPHVSGLAALVWMYRPALSMRQVKEILLGSVTEMETLHGKVLTGGRINARKALEMASRLEAPLSPVHPPAGLAFEDADTRLGVIGGTVTITAAANESDVEYYKVYLVSHAGYQLDAVGTVNATGAASLVVQFANRSIPKYAAGLVAVAGNATGEMPAQIGGPAPNFTLYDLVEPQRGPQAARWEGDEDSRPGVVAGRLVVTRAEDEETVSKYNIYWRNSSGRGPLLGSLSAIGYVKPSCSGWSCDLLNVSRSSDGSLSYSRKDYVDDELATIVGSGPATVTVTSFDTEQYYDSLVIGHRDFSGQPPVPFTEELPQGRFRIEWYSDSSITASGWSFDLLQNGTSAELQIASTVPHGQGLEVVAAYGGRERTPGIYVEVTDNGNASQSPSGAELGLGKAAKAVASSKTEISAAVAAADTGRSSQSSAATSQGKPRPPRRQNNTVVEPWLQQQQTEERHVVWPEGGARRLSAGRGAAAEHVRCVAVLPGVDASTLKAQPARAAMAASLEAALPHVGSGGVLVTRILATNAPDEAATSIEFMAEPSPSAPAYALDRIEARLLLLGKGGSGTEGLRTDLVKRMARAGLDLPAHTRVELQLPQQVLSQRGAGRALSQAVIGLGQDQSWRASEVAAPAALLGAVALLLAAPVMRRRRLSGGTEFTAAIDAHLP